MITVGFMEVWSPVFRGIFVCSRTRGQRWEVGRWQWADGKQTLLGLRWVLHMEVVGRTGQQFSEICLHLATAALTRSLLLPLTTKDSQSSVAFNPLVSRERLHRTHSALCSPSACHHRLGRATAFQNLSFLLICLVCGKKKNTRYHL